MEAARTFLCFVGDHKMFASWREKFVNEHKSVRQEAHRRLMKMCGGSGKHGNIPPKEFIPHNLIVEERKCGKCDEIFESKSDVKIHIQFYQSIILKIADMYIPEAISSILHV